MLPFGVLDLGRRTTHFTPDEQKTVMTLWSIARSPLMHGGDMTKMDPFTLSLLTNDEVLAVNQKSTNNRPLFDRDNLIGWVADVPGSPAKFLALFNARDRISLAPERTAWTSGIVGRTTPGQGEAIDVDIAGATKLILVAADGGDDNRWDHALWAEPRLVAADGAEKKLTDLEWTSASAQWGLVSKEKAPSGNPMTVAGRAVSFGIGAHAKSIIEFDLPPGFARFRAIAALDDAAMPIAYGGTIRFLVFAVRDVDMGPAAGLPVAVDLASLGFRGSVRVRDLWTHQVLGTFRKEFAPVLPWHGAGLYRVSPPAR
jgi:alpha-galactosidase